MNEWMEGWLDWCAGCFNLMRDRWERNGGPQRKSGVKVKPSNLHTVVWLNVKPLYSSESLMESCLPAGLRSTPQHKSVTGVRLGPLLREWARPKITRFKVYSHKNRKWKWAQCVCACVFYLKLVNKTWVFLIYLNKGQSKGIYWVIKLEAWECWPSVW